MLKTKKEKFTALLDFVTASTENGTLDADTGSIYADFIRSELTLLDNRATSSKENRKPTKQQEENRALMDSLLSTLQAATSPMSMKDLRALPEFAAYDSQKLSALLRLMYDPKEGEPTVVRTVGTKKVAYFSAVK